MADHTATDGEATDQISGQKNKEVATKAQGRRMATGGRKKTAKGATPRSSAPKKPKRVERP